jgi:biopolymer transport protein ExbB/TolQ
MRARLIFIVVAVVLVGGFAVQNWAEFTRASSLSFGPISMTLSLGLVMLTLLGIALLAFLVSAAAQESRHLLEHRRHTRALQAQRDLAEKAEASRFTDLRQHLDTHLRETRQQEATVATEFEKTVMQSQRELRVQLEQMNHMLSTRLSELEGRLAGRAQVTGDAPVVADVPVRDRVRL